MKDKEHRSNKAKLLFMKGFSLEEIAIELEKSLRTIQGYKKESLLEGDNWEDARELYNLSPAQIKKQYLIQVKEVIMEAAQDKDYKRSPGYADAMTKHLNNLKKLDIGIFGIGIIIDLLTLIARVINEHNPELAEQMKELYPIIKDEFKEQYLKDSVL